MMISRFLKPTTVCRNVIRHKNVRLFSTPAYPYMLIDYIINWVHSSDDYLRGTSDGRFRVTSMNYTSSDKVKEQNILIKDKEFEKEVRHPMTLGFYHNGVRFTMSEQASFFSIHYQNPSDLKSKSVNVGLPLPTGSRIQHLAMSSSPDLDNKDWTVAVKLSGSQVRLHRPVCHEWIDIKTAPGCIYPFSNLMYSKKDEMFYIPTLGGEHLCSLDLHFKKSDHPEFSPMGTKDLSRSVVHQLDELNSVLRTDHLVDSPTGEKLLVKWYCGDSTEYFNGVTTVLLKTKGFKVFKSDSPKDKFSYTDNIGDLCIFLGHGEAFCVPASSSSGLKPNCIYFVGYNFGVYDMTTKLCTIFFNDEGPLESTEFPYWPSPVSLCS